MSGNISQKQIEANRRNAQLSTGPKTDEGKQRVRFNALKHGLLAKAIVVPSENNAESQAAFDELLSAFREEMRPDGIVEEMLVEEIAVAYWRLRRAIRVESGEIKDRHERYEKHGWDFDSDRMALPTEGDLQKFMRYEAAAERRLHRALVQIDRRQKSRRIRRRNGAR